MVTLKLFVACVLTAGFSITSGWRFEFVDVAPAYLATAREERARCEQAQAATPGAFVNCLSQLEHQARDLYVYLSSDVPLGSAVDAASLSLPCDAARFAWIADEPRSCPPHETCPSRTRDVFGNTPGANR